ncbi:RAQPRD family integrative conjugative element protein [Pasteurella atlantica]|uniref:RAQPRD family integrative conjugative element protein n=2 Tax=Pasteurellaceae TaxID=712 RepID=A0ACC6HKV7_9PAST|nr:RAQPRD family integrative conjugative element protein [Pasteurella atlantica]MDP8051507.1 RAQPRD family integrative conjugative element protein [Pasteurella atlantica]MDP8104914.1 RAQPRD family integrative conjugative element protein [Pasteurella atlantica]MDP8148288.1 RAQPRD family integrative conjugative element protein [Pasteurella atlantica]
MKFFKLLTLLFVLSIVTSVEANEQSDIYQILQDINYTKEVIKKLKTTHKNCKDKVCFNYDALLKQLYVTELGIKEYLNLNVNSIHIKPPKPLAEKLYKVRKN